MKLLLTDLDRRLQGSAYQGYAYAYPHKTAYRPFETPIPLEDLWRDEDKSALFLYVHVPFCEYRCGFCNLFTRTGAGDGLVERTLRTLERQAALTRRALGEASFARFAVGGGTPTQLDLQGLARIFDVAESLGARPREIPCSIEMSPDSVDPEKLALLRERGVDRASLGVQSFVEAEVRASGRPQRTADVERALEWIGDAGFPVVNVDLIYGLPGQTLASWDDSLTRTLEYAPEEVFLYPLYVRPLTGLGRRGDEPEDAVRLSLYRQGRDRLLDAGYRQVSMRLFRHEASSDVDGPAYCCQEDGMVGLGCGARSYTRGVHYASEYAVGARGVRAIIDAWTERSDTELAAADYGFRLDAEEKRRRYAIQSLLWQSGLVFSDYRRRFGSDATDDLPQLAELAPRGLATLAEGALRLTPAGLELSDVLGPWLTSARVQALVEEYELR